MELQRRLDAFARLSDFLKSVATCSDNDLPAGLEEHYHKFCELIPGLYLNNGWFAEEFVRYQLGSLAKATTEENLNTWIGKYPQIESLKGEKTVAVIMAGNVPFVGFSDFISVLITGHKFLGKLSSKDNILPKAVADVLITIEPEFENYILFTDGKLSNYDAVIATGSDNSARYFEYYFSGVPNIIRRNRTSVAVLYGDETKERLEALSDDVFLYFGLGCRNVSKIFVPEDFDLNRIFEAFYKYRHIIDYNKYANNYDYNRAIYLMNGEQFLDNGFVMLKESLDLVSPTAVVYYQKYSAPSKIPAYLDAYRDKIQCIVSDSVIEGYQTVPLGMSQVPMLWEYPDNIDLIDFLSKI